MSSSIWRVFLVFSLGTLIATWLLQWVLLGWVLPTWADSAGLLKGHDSVRFHAVAASQAALIQAEGWSSWELRPQRWGISGLMSAWYAVFGPYPASWAIAQAAVYGASVTLLFAIVVRITRDRVVAAFSVLPALLLPSTLAIYVFPHRDVFVFFGMMLALYGFVRLSSLERLSGRGRLLWVGLGSALVLAGYMIAGVVRVFTGEIFLGVAGIVFLVLSFKFGLCSLWQRQVRFSNLIGPLVVLALLVVMVVLGKPSYFDAELKSVDAKSFGQFSLDGVPEDATSFGQPPLEGAPENASATGSGWQRTAWLPGVVDGKLRRVAGARDRFLRISGHGRSVIDHHIHFRSTTDMLGYAPRALQIGLFAPFPQHWKAHPDAPASRNLERAVVGGEMMILYGLFPFLFLAIWLYRRQTALWVALLPALGWVWVYATTVPVVGALVRYRYGAYILIIAIAMAGLGEAIRRMYNWSRARAA